MREGEYGEDESKVEKNNSEKGSIVMYSLEFGNLNEPLFCVCKIDEQMK